MKSKLNRMKNKVDKWKLTAIHRAKVAARYQCELEVYQAHVIALRQAIARIATSGHPECSCGYDLSVLLNPTGIKSLIKRAKNKRSKNV